MGNLRINWQVVNPENRFAQSSYGLPVKDKFKSKIGGGIRHDLIGDNKNREKFSFYHLGELVTHNGKTTKGTW